MDTVKNNVQLTGKIGKLCQFREFANGRKKGVISLGTTESFYKNEVKVFKTDWHNLVVWGKLAKEMESGCATGVKITVTGKLVSRSYTDNADTKRFITEVEVKEFSIVNSKEAVS